MADMTTAKTLHVPLAALWTSAGAQTTLSRVKAMPGAMAAWPFTFQHLLYKRWFCFKCDRIKIGGYIDVIS